MKTLIQVGSHFGDDEFQKYCEQFSETCKIVLIEANPFLIPRLKENYKKIEEQHEVFYIQNAITLDENDNFATLYMDENPDGHGFSSLINRSSYPLNKQIKVPAKTLNKIFEELNLNVIDELHIDTEGLDYEIVLSLDIEKYNINIITCEKWSHENDDKNNKYRTGSSLLNNIFEKFQNYDISEISYSGMPSLKFIKKL